MHVLLAGLGALCLLGGAAQPAGAGGVEGAARLVEETSERLFTAVRQETSAVAADPARASALVDEIVSPQVDYRRVARSTLGRHWRDASPEQQERLVAELRTLLVRSYAGTVVEHAGADVEYLPARASAAGDEAAVPTKVSRASGPPLRIDYRLHRTNGEWKLFDVVVGGASLVTTHRHSFSERIAQGGIEGLIRSLADKNATTRRQT